GSFPIDTVAQTWWDLEGGRLRQASGHGATVSVAVVAAPRPPGERLELWLFVATTAVGVLALIWWVWPRLRAARAARQARWLGSEPKAFRDLQAACRHGDARAVYGAFAAWRQRIARPLPSSFAEEVEAGLFAGAPWTTEQAVSFAARLERFRTTG